MKLAGALVVGLALGGVALGACRGAEPGEDPRTPANTPLPNIDRKDPDRGGEPPSPPGRDAG